MPSPRILIVGCGIAGPVLGNFFKRKGYDPIIFEKVKELGDAGASLMLMPNGMKVLGLVGLAESIRAQTSPLDALIESNANGDLLASSPLPASWEASHSQPATGVRRTNINLMLRDNVISHGVEVRYGYELEDFQEDDCCIRAMFTNGETVVGDFLIGCDGIKSKTRTVLVKRHGVQEGQPVFTGLSQTAGISSTPQKLKSVPAMRNWYGSGVHVIAYPVSTSHTSWAITLPEKDEAQESWRLRSDDEIETQRAELRQSIAGFESGVQDMLSSCERIVKFGLFDRPELPPKYWYSARCVLVGDAAHPTSPHLGQGANQALEDCFHLSHAFPNLLETGPQVYKSSLCDLKSIFAEYAEKRAARTAMLVKGARANGQRRVVTSGAADCSRRDDEIKRMFCDPAAVAEKYDGIFREPFNPSMLS